jgi:hypothetical protein
MSLSRAAEHRRAAAFGLVGAVLAALMLFSLNLALPLGAIDFDQVWWAARCLIEGTDPYEVVQPPRYSFPLYYPLTSAMLVLPLGWLDFSTARMVFVGVSGGIFGYAIGRYRPWLWPSFLSLPFILFASCGQWSALLSGAILLPWLGPLAVAKPNLGLATLAAARSRRAAAILVVGSAILLLLSLLLDPGWPWKWVAALERSTHFRPLILRPGGFLVLLALWRWRDADARLLLALALVPTTGMPYDLLPAALVARNRKESAALTLLTQIAWVAAPGFPVYEPYADWSWRAGIPTLWGSLLPAVALVLWRGRGPVAQKGAPGHFSAGGSVAAPPAS